MPGRGRRSFAKNQAGNKAEMLPELQNSQPEFSEAMGPLPKMRPTDVFVDANGIV